jgi:non-homologous end joining protein Ku
MCTNEVGTIPVNVAVRWRCAMGSKTRLAALRVKDFSERDVMVIHTLLRPDEIRDPDFPVLDEELEIKPASWRWRARWWS